MAEYHFEDESTGCEFFLRVFRKIHPRRKKIVFTQVRDRTSGTVTKGTIMQVQITDVQSVDFTVAAADAKGNAAQVTNLVWSVSDAAGLSVTPNVDGTVGTVSAVGPLGTFQAVVTGNGVLPDGTADPADVLTGTVDVVVVASEAATLVVSAGTPTP